ncbi:unnamed protein product [Ceutorhynchus assimilis]|uniref:Uncharacterized protein n=1 Tax=Ceutorhynchus assimilis TaxID=467358 RepID=A0A9N9QR86_9CUCU|nr:unnamed protein product [Ceutorhynchus assimilis]
MQTYEPSAHRFKASSNVCVDTFLQGRGMNKFTSQMKRFNKIRQATSRKLNAMTQTIGSYHEVGYRCRIETVETFDNLQQLIEAYHDEDAFMVRRGAILERMIDSGVLTRISGLDWRRHLVDCGILNDCEILDSALRLFKNYDGTIQLPRMSWPEVPSTSFQKVSNESMRQEDELVRSDLRRAIEKSPSNIPWRHWLRKSCDQKPTLEENENHDEEEDCSNVANDEDNSENGISESSESDYDAKPAELDADQKTRPKKVLPEFLLPTRLPMNVGIGPSLMCQRDIVKAYVAANRMKFFLEGTYLKGKKLEIDLVRLMREPARRNKRKVGHVQAMKGTELFLQEYEDQNKHLPKLSPMVMHLFDRQIGIVGNAIRVAEKRVEKFLTSDSTTPNEDSLVFIYWATALAHIGPDGHRKNPSWQIGFYNSKRRCRHYFDASVTNGIVGIVCD